MEKRSSYAFTIMVNNTMVWPQGKKKKRRRRKRFLKKVGGEAATNKFERPSTDLAHPWVVRTLPALMPTFPRKGVG